jgi:hypothetical protein
MDNKFDIFKLDFTGLELYNSLPPLTENDIRVFEEQKAYQATKKEFGCCCPTTAYNLKKLYHFRDFITISDFNIFEKALDQHPFRNSNRASTKADLLKALEEIKEKIEFLSHNDLKRYFLECVGGELRLAVKDALTGMSPLFEKHLNDMFRDIRDDIIIESSFPIEGKIYSFENWLNGEVDVFNYDVLFEHFDIPQRSKILEHSKKLILEKAEIKYNKLVLDFSETFKKVFDKSEYIEQQLLWYDTILKKNLTNNDLDIINLGGAKVVYVKTKITQLSYETVKLIQKHYEWFISGVINCIVENPKNEHSFGLESESCVDAIAYAKYYKYLKEYNINAQLLQQNTPSVSTSLQNDSKPKEEVNLFCKGMPLNMVREHFRVLTTNISKNNKKPFLTNEQFEAFIKRAFLEDKSIEPITLNYSKTKENLFIVKRFYQFYDKAITDDYTTRNDSKEKYIKILTDNFSEWEFDKVLQNFGDKVKRSWIEAKV